MKSFEQIQKEIESSFESYFESLLITNGIPRKYFYWDTDFLVNEDNLNFGYFELDVEIKEEINNLGALYFNSNDVYFIVNKNSHRHDLTVNNFVKIFSEKNKKDQTLRYEYIKEFIFWQLLARVESIYKDRLDQLVKDHSIKQDEETKTSIRQVENYLQLLPKIIQIQRKNFLITYIQFSTRTGKGFKNPDYLPFKSMDQYQDITDKLVTLSVEQRDKNELIKLKIDRLYIHKDFRDKIHFIFSFHGGAGKEELRELLDVMGEKSGEDLKWDYYRGQADASWILDASIRREQKYRDRETDMYYDILSLKPEAFRDDKGAYDRLITMQHFGMPTRLLDISRNPLIAVFFACNNLERGNKDGLIYCFSPNEKVKLLHFEDKKLDALESMYKDEKPDSEFLKGISFLKGVAKNQRINNQSGDFIFVGDGEDILEDLNDLPLMHIVIDSYSKKALLEQLESLNIHAGSVYPDLTHLSKYISEKYKKASGLKAIARPSESKEDDTKSELEWKVDFSVEEFWSDDRKVTLKELVKDYSLKEKEVKEQLDYFIDHGSFEDYKIIGLLKKKPPLNERDKTRKNLKSLLIDFLKE